METMGNEIEKLENENITLEQENKTYNEEVRKYIQKQKKFEKMNQDSELTWITKQNNMKNEISELSAKLKNQEAELKGITREYQELLKTSKSMSDSLIVKTKEYSRLHDRMILIDYRV